MCPKDRNVPADRIMDGHTGAMLGTGRDIIKCPYLCASQVKASIKDARPQHVNWSHAQVMYIYASIVKTNIEVLYM